MGVNRGSAGLLTAVFLGTFMALLDMSIVNVALAAMQRDLAAGLSGVQWVVDAYTLCLSAFVLSGGSLGDRHGRRRVFLAGIVVFTTGSAVCAFAPGLGVLVGGRVVQGVAAAVVTPGALSLLAQAFPDPAARARAIGMWGTCSGLAVVLGPVLGGVLVDRFGWPGIFLINLPLGALTLVLGLRCIPESADPENAAADPLGQITGAAWLGALSYALIQGGHRGWTAGPTLTALAFAAVTFAGFLLVELRQSQPMLPVRLFGSAPFAVVNAASFALGFGAYAVYFLLSLYQQEVRGNTPTATGVKFLPLSVAIAAASACAGRLTGRHGPRPALLAGYGLVAAALLGMVGLGPHTGYATAAVLFAVLGAGMGLAITPTNAAVLTAVPRERSGIASATVNATRQTGTAVGVALLGSLLTGRAAAHLGAALDRAGVRASTSGHGLARQVVADGGHDRDHAVPLPPARFHRLFAEAFGDGLHLSLLIAGAVTLAAVVLVAAGLPGRPAGARPEPDRPGAPAHRSRP